MQVSFISTHSIRINAWSDRVGSSSSIAHRSNGPSSVVVNIRSIIEPLVLFPGLVIAPCSLFRIRSKSSIIVSKGPASFRCIINGSHTGLCALKSPNNTALPRSSGCHWISSIARQVRSASPL
jgi:hypothetical protein